MKTGSKTNNGCQNYTKNYTLKKKKKKKPKQNKRGSGIVRVYILLVSLSFSLTTLLYVKQYEQCSVW